MAASTIAHFVLPNSQYRVLTCDYSISQPTDSRGRPSAGVRSGLLRVLLDGSDYAMLTEWAVKPDLALNGHIHFENSIGGTFKVLTFEQGYCVSYREIFTPHDGIAAAYTFDLGISAAKIYLNDKGTLHNNQWLDWKITQ